MKDEHENDHQDHVLECLARDGMEMGNVVGVLQEYGMEREPEGGRGTRCAKNGLVVEVHPC